MSSYKIFSRSEKSRDKEHKVNEDCYIYTEYCFMNDERIKILAVADGMGGLSDGEKASFHAVEGFSKEFYRLVLNSYMTSQYDNFSMTHYADRLEEIIKNAFCEANRNVCKNANPFVETGTTLSVVVILSDYALVANVGDSPVYYYNSYTDEFKMVSKIHTRAEKNVEMGIYDRYSKEYYANSHIVYKSLGEKEELNENDIYVNTIGYIREKDMFILGTDGAFGLLKEGEIFRVTKETKYSQALKNLFSEARVDKNDDQTAIMYCVCGEEEL